MKNNSLEFVVSKKDTDEELKENELTNSWNENLLFFPISHRAKSNLNCKSKFIK